MPVETWKSIADWATIVFIALTVVSGSAALILGDRMNEKQAEQLRKFNEDITAAKTELGVQQERAANAERQLEEIRERQSSRVITNEQANIIKSALASARGQYVEVFTFMGETEIANFANRLVSVLRDAGLTVGNSQGRVRDEPLPVGIKLSFGTNREALATILHATFTKAGLGVEPLAAPRETNANALVIMIGAKP